MSAARQLDLFAAPAAEAMPAEDPDFVPYTWEELEALGRQLQAFDRVPDEWLAGWNAMESRGYWTMQRMPRAQRDVARAMFLDQVDRLREVDCAETEAAKAAEAAALASAPKPKRRRAA